jgi:hypothetical protein
MWTWILIVALYVGNGLLFRFLGGFESAGEAMRRWGEATARRRQARLTGRSG